jgi:hypothetical protein
MSTDGLSASSERPSYVRVSTHGGPFGCPQHPGASRRDAAERSGSTPCGKCMRICTIGLKPSTLLIGSGNSGGPFGSGRPLAGMFSRKPVAVLASFTRKRDDG